MCRKTAILGYKIKLIVASYPIMASEQLHITLIQPDIVWEDKTANLQHYEHMIAEIKGEKNIVALPEMFSTGFSMAPERLAEAMNGQTVSWMTGMAVKYRCILTGSLIIEEDGKYFNRMLWVQPDGTTGTYDKRHLFGFAGEDKHYSRGEKRLIAQVNGWRINVMVCYDLRFPVWARNVPIRHAGTHAGEQDLEAEYDMLLYVANWPETRSLAWRSLLQARAIENQCYVAGVNRVGKDGKGYYYAGESSIFGPLGEKIWQAGNEVVCKTVTLEKETLNKVRNGFPFLNDADKFILL
jgi:predicted amidohydrolase